MVFLVYTDGLIRKKVFGNNVWCQKSW